MTIHGGDYVSSDIICEDLRSIKTEKALYAAISSLLRNLNFRKITIKGICEEALISRATFYAHYIDKYDLLKHWIIELWPRGFNKDDNYEKVEKAVNDHMHEYTLILKNVAYDADDETIGILFDFIFSTINVSVEKNDSEGTYHKNIVLSNFYAGGIISYFLWQIKSKFPSDVPLMNKYFYEMVLWLQEWQSKQG